MCSLFDIVADVTTIIQGGEDGFFDHEIFLVKDFLQLLEANNNKYSAPKATTVTRHPSRRMDRWKT